MAPKKNRIPPRERAVKCEKVGTCIDNSGDPLSHCSNAPSYFDYAFPASEDICSRLAESAEIHNQDPYKESYIRICQYIDATIANIYLKPEKIDERFSSIESALSRLVSYSPRYVEGGNLEKILTSDDKDLMIKGRLAYHVSARMLQASLGLFAHRAMNRDEPFGKDIMLATDREYAKILSDFDEDGIYSLHPEIVAHKRTEVSIAKILSRTMQPETFFMPALYREEASQSKDENHDGIIFTGPDKKIIISIKNTDYSNRKNSKSSLETYQDRRKVIVIHQDVVGLDYREGELIEFHVNPTTSTVHTDDEPFPYEHLDPDADKRYTRWGASGTKKTVDESESFMFTQQIAGNRGNELMRALIDEAFGRPLNLNQMNVLNVASHYLISVIRETVG